ncbi:MAG: DEAD/DEAH box helicase, partial [Marinicella sp.]
FLTVKVSALYGGVKLGGQANKLATGLDILISTPGRLLDHIELDHVSLAEVEFVVLDEADRMLDMGFIADVQKIVSQTATQHQTLLFSATTSAVMNELAHKILKNHQEIRISKANTTADTVAHVMYPVSEERKMDLFLDLLEEYNWYQILVFTSTKKQADHLLDRLKKAQIPAAICHGDKSQGSRRRALADFKSAKLQVMIATEVAARGLDIEGLDFVLNYNLPYLPEDYVHRIGRTGRAGNAGQAISFVCPEEAHTLDRIEKVIGTEIKKIYKRGYELLGREIVSKSKPKPNNGRKKGGHKKSAYGQTASQTKTRKKKSITSRAGGKKSKSGKRR